MEQFTIKTAFAMGEPHEQYGQSWYATVQEMAFPVMFNLMSGSVQEMDKITFETQEISKFKSGKNVGKEYRRLKKVRVLEGAPRMIQPNSKAAEQPSEVLSDILKRLVALEDKVFGGDVEDRNDDSAKSETQLDDVVDYDEQEPINLDSIPF